MGTRQTDLSTPPDPERNSMVSAPHEAMHRIFQEDPGLFPGSPASSGSTCRPSGRASP